VSSAPPDKTNQKDFKHVENYYQHYFYNESEEIDNRDNNRDIITVSSKVTS
jgi:hypothetical protein